MKRDCEERGSQRVNAWDAGRIVTINYKINDIYKGT